MPPSDNDKDEPGVTQTKGLPQWALVLMLLGGGTTAGFTVSDLFKVKLSDKELERIARAARPDPFTATMAAQMRTELDREIQKRATFEQTVSLVCNELRLLRAEMPPGPTKERIVAVEQAIREQHGQSPPTQRWAGLPPACKPGNPW